MFQITVYLTTEKATCSRTFSLIDKNKRTTRIERRKIIERKLESYAHTPFGAPPPPHPSANWVTGGGGVSVRGHEQWGWRLERWPNTVARLAGWRGEIQQVWFWTWWTDFTAGLFRTVPFALPGAAQLRDDGISSCCYVVNVHNHPSWATSRKEGMAWYSRAWV
jgi:hypothetical protein